MRVLDFTHRIEPDMPVYPGTEPPRLSPANTYEKDGFRETLLSLYSHTGTHMDAPAHLFAHQPTLDALPAAQFVGPALVVDCSDAAAGAVLTMERLAPVRQLADRAAFLLIRTGWDRFWGTPDYYGDYPVIGPDVVEYLIGSGKQGIGLDTIGVDAIYNETLPIHQKLLGTGRMVVIENLTGLDRAGGGLFCLRSGPGDAVLHRGPPQGCVRFGHRRRRKDRGAGRGA